MIISSSHKFIFVHVPKTAGVSISVALKDYCDPFLWYQMQRRRMDWHWPAYEIKTSIKDWESFYKFSVVRNPFDWLVSFYHNSQRRRGHIIGGDRYQRLIRFAKEGEFRKFVVEILKGWMTKKRAPMSHWVCDYDGSILVDDILRFEVLKNDWNIVRRKLSIQAQLPWKNKSKINDYRKEYRSCPDLVRPLTRFFSEDLERWGYEF